MHACDFSEKGLKCTKKLKRGKKGKIFENFGKNVQNSNIFERADDYVRFSHAINCQKRP